MRNGGRRVWNDFVAIKAKADGFVARSAPKLQAIQSKFHLIRKGDAVIDLGCAPGAWIQIAAALCGIPKLGRSSNGEAWSNGRAGQQHRRRGEGLIVGIDVAPVSPEVVDKYDETRVSILREDVFSSRLNRQLAGRKFNVLLSDMSHKTVGQRHTDAVRSLELAGRALQLAVGICPLSSSGGLEEVESGDESGDDDGVEEEPLLLAGGHAVCKILDLESGRQLFTFCKQRFQKVSWCRPPACRKGSSEMYLVAQGFIPSMYGEGTLS